MNYHFVKDGEHYRRFDETHYQRAYKVDEIVHRLKHNGFKSIEVYQPFMLKPQRRGAERIFSHPGRFEFE